MTTMMSPRLKRILNVTGMALAITWMLTAPFGLQGVASGDTFLLSDLIASGDPVDVSDTLRFDQFSYDHTGDMPPASEVNVITEPGDPEGHIGLLFQGNFSDLFSSEGGSDALIRYRVSPLEGAPAIIDAHLYANPADLGGPGGLGSISVTEDFFFDTIGEHQLRVFVDEQAGRLNRAWTVFPERRELNVSKDIAALAAETGTVTMSFVTQTFSIVPETSTAVFMLIGAITLAFAKWRRQRRT